MAENGAWPTFLILGAPKAGTTALYRWLEQHPQVVVSPNKQPHFFAGLRPEFRGPGDDLLNRDLVNDPDAYRRLFSARGRNALARGEASPFYLHYAAVAAPRIRAAVPDCRLVVLLREPVSRAYSGYLHLVRDGRERGSFADALRSEDERVRRGWEPLWAHRALGCYGAQLGSVLEHFPREQLGVWTYEELSRRPAETFAAVCRFIGVDPGFVPEFTHHNTGGAPRHPWLHGLLVRLKVPHIAKAVLPEPLAQWVVSRYLEHRPAPAEQAASLLSFYRDDLAELRRLLPETDLGAWARGA